MSSNLATMSILEARSVEYSRPEFERQRSKSAPEFPLLDVTASETIMLCTAAASASDRRRRSRGQDRRYVSLDIDVERSRSRPARQTESSDATSEPSLSAVQLEEPTSGIPTVHTYAQSMAQFMQQRIEAVRRASEERFARLLSDSKNRYDQDYYDVVSSYGGDDDDDDDDDDDEDLEVSELGQASVQSILKGLARPPLRSAFSAYSTATSSPTEENFTFFDFPQSSNDTDDNDEQTDYSSHADAPNTLCDSPMSNEHNFPVSSSNASTPKTPRCPLSKQTSKEEYFPEQKSTPMSFSTPIYTPTQQYYFASQRSATASRASRLARHGSFDAFKFPPSQNFSCVPNTQSCMIEGQIFEICH